MKQLKSSLSDLRDIFDRSIMIRDIAEPVVSLDDHDEAEDVKQFMGEHDYDYLAVRSRGHIAGYAIRNKIGSGRLGAWLEIFEPERLVSDRTSLLEAISRMRAVNPLFVAAHDKVWGIVTKGDLQKFPVRMWLFGVLSMVEMQMLRLIRQYVPNDGWRLDQKRLADAKKIFDQRRQQNQAIDIDDCFQWCDKATIIAANEGLRTALGFGGKGDFEKRLARMERLRNSLAQANDLLTGNWPKLIDVIEDAEKLLNAAERVSSPEPPEATP